MDLTTRILIFYVVLVVSLVVHEAAHALFALLGGDRTAYHGGQVTLNPIPHMQREPMGTIFIPLIALIMSKGMMCFGFAHAPYDPNWAARHPKRAALMAAAGPLSNILLAAIAFTVLEVLIQTDQARIISGMRGPLMAFSDRLEMLDPVGGSQGYVAATVKIASVFLFLNVLLAMLNLLPIPPFDGGSIVEGLFPKTRPFFEFLRAQVFTLILGLVIAWNLLNEFFWPTLGWIYRQL